MIGANEKIGRGFARCIWRVGRVGGVLGEWRPVRGQRAVDFVGRNMMKAARASRPVLRPYFAGSFQELVGSAHVGVDEWIRTTNRAVDVRFSREVYDRI